MKKTLLVAVAFALLLSSCTTNAQKSQPSLFVLVHGAWGGGWAFKEVDSLLTAKGHIVYRPTLTGQGEKVHLADKSIGLDTHIADIVNVIKYEELDDIILVGHSYGGMVVTGVANQLSDRIKHLVYLDAVVPSNGESAASIMGSLGISTDGFIIPSWVREDQQPPKDVPHPAKTWSDSIVVDDELLKGLSTTYILTVDSGKSAAQDDFYSQSQRAQNRGWSVLQLEADHNAQWSAPVELSEMLDRIAK